MNMNSKFAKSENLIQVKSKLGNNTYNSDSTNKNNSKLVNNYSWNKMMNILIMKMKILLNLQKKKKMIIVFYKKIQLNKQQKKIRMELIKKIIF